MGGDVVACLQEVPAWGKINGFTYSGHTIISSQGCDCAFIIPRLWMSKCKEFTWGDYWCGIVIHNTIFISAHVLDHLEEHGRASVVFQDTVRFVHRIRNANQHMQFNVVVGVDANVQFPAYLGTLTGPRVFCRKKAYPRSLIRVTSS